MWFVQLHRARSRFLCSCSCQQHGLTVALVHRASVQISAWPAARLARRSPNHQPLITFIRPFLLYPSSRYSHHCGVTPEPYWDAPQRAQSAPSGRTLRLSAVELWCETRLGDRLHRLGPRRRGNASLLSGGGPSSSATPVSDPMVAQTAQEHHHIGSDPGAQQLGEESFSAQFSEGAPPFPGRSCSHPRPGCDATSDASHPTFRVSRAPPREDSIDGGAFEAPARSPAIGSRTRISSNRRRSAVGGGEGAGWLRRSRTDGGGDDMGGSGEPERACVTK